jgi:pilus assembly protein CpaB
MKASRMIVIGVAVIASLLLALVVRGMMSGNGSSEATAKVTPEVPANKILVAARDLKIGERLTEADVVWKPWPADSLSPAYIIDGPGAALVSAEEVKAAPEPPKPEPAQDDIAKTGQKVAEVADKVLNPTRGMESVLGAVVREDIMSNEPLVLRKLVRSDQGGYMSVILAAGMRAMAVPVSVENTAGGFILPGDRVDVVVAEEVKKQDGSSTFIARQILANIKILAIDQTAQPQKDQQSVVGATATLEVSSTDGQVLAQAKARGALSLMLRSYADINGPSGRVGLAPEAQLAAAGRKVTVYRNGQATEVQVTR